MIGSDVHEQLEGIEELIALFRKYGGKFENMTLGYREESGFYCYTLDGSQDSLVSCPAHLLVDCDDVDISQDGLFITNPNKYEHNMEFLEKYFAFHFNKRMLGQYIERKHHIDALSSQDLSLISRVIPSMQSMSEKMGELAFAKKQIFKSHKIHYFGKEVFMPFVTFLNYDKNGAPYDVKKEGISVSGKFSEEVFALYNMNDALLLASGHGFIADTRFAYALPMKKQMPNGARIVIDRKPQEFTNTHNESHWPLIHKDNVTTTISWFPLYFEGGPLYPARVAQAIARDTDFSAEIFLNAIFEVNLNALITVAFQLRDSENPYAQMIAAAAQRQLEVLGGTRNG